MDYKEKIDYWLDMADYDLLSAKAMLDAKRFLYVGFLCHQVAEKCLKAYFWHTRESEPPFTHNLLLLAEQSKFNDKADGKHFSLFDQLMPLNIQARYPEDKELLLKALTLKRCESFYQDTEEFYKWIKISLK